MMGMILFISFLLMVVLILKTAIGKNENFFCIDCEEVYELAECGSLQGEIQRCIECEDNHITGFNDEDPHLYI